MAQTAVPQLDQASRQAHRWFDELATKGELARPEEVPRSTTGLDPTRLARRPFVHGAGR